MTAVQWLEKTLINYFPDAKFKGFIERAKEMEKEQIIEIASAYYHENTKLTPTQYYNETYGGNK